MVSVQTAQLQKHLPFRRGERVFAQEVEVAAAVGLQDLVAVEAGVAAFGDWRRRDRAAGELVGWTA